MGYLHEGHESLIRKCSEQNDLCAVSIFINPLQFNDPEDYEKYPVDLDRDSEICNRAGADLLFFPSRSEILGEKNRPPLIKMTMPDLTETLCGPGRPGHFEGVLLIVSRLFHIVQPDRAYFGKKDYQQFRIVRRMVEDLAFPVEVVGLPTVRTDDGLAMSSRNSRLDSHSREDALLIYRGMKLVEKSYQQGERDPIKLESIARDVIESSPYATIEYVQIVHPENLKHLQSRAALEDAGRFVLGVAASFQGVRLIDNMEIQ